MARYIDAERLINEISGNGGVFVYGPQAVSAIVSRINVQPSADVEEVVRCGKCKSFIQSKEDECAGTCNHPMSGLSGRICKSDFCSYGERRMDNDL